MNAQEMQRTMTTPGDPRTIRLAARRLAEAIRSGYCPTDGAFDRFLPAPLKTVSLQYWSPVVVAQRAAAWFDDAGIQSVVDIGSGAGKFCVAAALFGECHFIGLEQRARLVGAARALAQLLGVNDRVRFVHGAVGAAPIQVADAYYLFNPFGEYWFGSDDFVDTDVSESAEQYAHDIATVENLLRCAPARTCVLTYNGFGGRIPDDYELIRVDQQLPGPLRLWRKSRDANPSARSRGTWASALSSSLAERKRRGMAHPSST